MSIRIYNPDELPYGLLSNNFNYKMFIDGEEWDNVSQYIYTNLIPIENKNYRDILKMTPYDQISSKYLQYESNIKDTFVKDVLIKGLEKRFDNEKVREYLLNTGNSRLFYINDNNLFFGTKESLIHKLKMLDYNESKNVLGQVFEEIRNRIHMKIIETDLIHQYIKLILLNDVIMASYEQIIELFMVLHNTKTNEEKQKIFSSFLMNNKLDVNSVNINVDEYKNEVKNDSELLKVLIISKRNPSCLVGYSLCKTIRKSNDRIKKYISNVVINKYLNYFMRVS